MTIACVVMASGHSKRFGQDKLMYPLDGIPVCERTFHALSLCAFSKVCVVARDKRIMDIASRMGFTPVQNNDVTDNIAMTIKLGVAALPEDTAGCLFCVADQPWLSEKSVSRLLESFNAGPHNIYALSWKGISGNPVLFPRALFSSLSTLQPGQSGKAVIAGNRRLLKLVEADNDQSLADVDYPADLKRYYYRQ